MLIVGILGGIASGKSLVALQFEQLGARRLDADRMGHEVLEEAGVTAKLVARWGNSILNEQQSIDRKAVAGRVFAAEAGAADELCFLESVTHPRIAARISDQLRSWAEGGDARVAVVDAAVLVKAGWRRFCDRTVFVEADRDTRLRRALARGWSEDEFASREAAQESLDEKREAADWVVYNGGSPDQTFAQIQSIWQTLGADSAAPEP